MKRKHLKLNIMGAIVAAITLSANLGFAQSFGASVPWTTYEAESGNTNGIVNTGSNDRSKVTYEASGRAVVELNAPESYIAIKSTVAANRITIRYSIPKGTNGTIGLFINKTHKQDINLTSVRSWNNKERLPGGFCRFFDEIILEAKVKPGDEIRLVKLNTENNPICTIDFIDLELTPAAIKKPDNTWLDVTKYGAKGNDEIDDTQAIKDCIEAAAKGSKKVWIPAGNFYINDQVNIVKGVQIAGAGMWYTVIKKNIPGAFQKRGFQMSDSTGIKNLKIDDILGNIRINNLEGIRFSGSTGVVIDGIWVANTFGAGILGTSASNAVIKNCRVFGTFADAIHIARKSFNCVAENNLVRNSGDDGLAIVTYNSAGCHDITYRNNTVWFNYWGRGITIIGGDHNTVERNLVIDGSKAGFLVAVEEYNKQITPYVTNFTVQHNRSVRCGDITNKAMGGIWLWGNVQTSPMSGDVSYNEVIDPVYNGISVTNWVPKEVNIYHNTIGKSLSNGLFIYSALKDGFSPTMHDNTEIAH